MLISTSALASAAFAASAWADSLSNRHHLTCTHQSAPVVIPHATARSVRLGLPADVGSRVQIEQIYGWDDETRLRLNRRGLSIDEQGGGATLRIDNRSGC